jgi:RimJ/RimL family protein N-acetyltransferase
MTYQIYLRSLVVEDALTSFQWRNNPKIWRFTGSRPDKPVTPEMETAWLRSVLGREDEKRFAICLCEDHRYIGNIYLTHISNNRAQLHIFLGDVQFWGKKRAFEAGWQALDYAFNTLQLELIFMEMHKNNPGMGGVIKMGWQPVAERENGFVEYVFSKDMFQQKLENIRSFLQE